MTHERERTYEHIAVRAPEDVYNLTRETVKKGELVCVFTDLDDTVLVGKEAEEGYTRGDDPRRVEILPAAGQALKEIGERGGIVGVITNRGGRDAANYLRASGVSQAYIIGTYGWERYTMDSENSQGDRVSIDRRFSKYARYITDSLATLRDYTYELFGEPISDDGANIIIPTNRKGLSTKDQAPLIIQQKGVSPEDGFPLGLANIYNFNLMSLGKRRQTKITKTPGRNAHHF